MRFESISNEPTNYLPLTVLTTIMILLLAAFSASATTYTVTTSGKWSSKKIWSPSYPGEYINPADTIIINDLVTFNKDVHLNGTLIVNGSLIGNKELKILSSGLLFVDGNCAFETLSSSGTIINNLILEVTENFENTGLVHNNESIIVGGNFSNLGGLVKGDNGHYFTNGEIVNSQNGSLVGNINLCYNGGITNAGRFDSLSISLCGEPLYEGVSLFADTKDGNIQLNVYNPGETTLKKFRIERSFDGQTFELIDVVTITEESFDNVALDYEDKVKFDNKIFYRIQTIDEEGSAEYLPTVQITKASNTEAAMAYAISEIVK